ncbi:MAG: hydroxymethylglutaryl-CoA reductase, degradative [Anaerolineae bacterium]|nr:hydroxymethylglutaryl-CoA reductase, degradative [Anaerolineae bacterium]
MTPKANSRLSGFYDLTIQERLARVREQVGLTDDEIRILGEGMGLSLDRAGAMVENAVGLYALPLGIATNFVVNGRDVLVPMAIEEPSVIAGASLAARLGRQSGGFTAEADDPIMIGQIQLVDLQDPYAAIEAVLASKERLMALANALDPVLVDLGGGARGIQARILSTAKGPMLIVHLLVDVRDAMGANAVNTACERLAPELAALTGGTPYLRILSNLADHRLAHARVAIPEEVLAFEAFTGAQVAEGIELAWAFAAADPYRAATNNKGIMNGVDAVVLATGNDWRAVEAGAHAYAARSGQYTSLSTWRRDGAGMLVGDLELPLALGTVGGATRVHPTAQVALKIMGVRSAGELAQVVASVGLAQNLAALRALATEGIQKGHMALHARQVAMAAGALGPDIDRIAEAMIEGHTIRIDVARSMLNQ